MVKRCTIMSVVVALVLTALPIARPAHGQDPIWPTGGWTVSTPEAQGLESGAVADYLLALGAPGLYVDSVMIVRHGQIVAEAYYAPSTADTRFSLYSATKSVTSTLVGIALEQGYLKSLDEPVLSFFPERTVANLDAWKEAMTLRDLLTMSSGFACDINAPADPETAVHSSEDWLQATLDLPMAGAPGSLWQYCNLNFELAAAILESATGQTALEFATANLFEPLGISEVAWATTPSGGSGGAAGLQLSLRDLAKLGYLHLRGGQWDGEQVVPAQWVADATATQVATPWGVGYGYGWWVFEMGPMALGGGGQYVFVLPGLDLVLAATSTATEATRTMYQLGVVLGGLMSMPYSAEPLAENSEGMARLAAAVEAAANPVASEAPTLPDTAAAVSGKRFGLFSPNLLRLDWRIEGVIPGLDTSGWDVAALSLSFADGEAALTLIFTDGQETIPVGLDGIYRVSEGRLGPIGAKGEWLTDTAFRVYLKHIGGSLQHRLDMTFNGPVLEIIAYEMKVGHVKVVYGAAN